MKTATIVARFQIHYAGFSLNAELTLPGSGISVLFGESGSGKTTLLRCMAGLEQPPVGYFRIGSQVWQDNSQKRFLPTHQRNLGYVFQDANLFPHLSVSGNLQYGLKRIANKPGDAGSLANIIDLLGIGHLLDRMPDRLSGGEKQRVAIARALALNPAILFMDEPLASLDGKRRQEVIPYLQALQREFALPIVYVTHSRQELMQLADYLVILDQGQVQAAGSLAEVLGRLDLPLAQEREAASVWQGTVRSQDEAFQLTQVEFKGVRLSLASIDLPPDTRLRVQIMARDVSIALQQPEQTSILNVLPATITGLVDEPGGQTIVKLQCGSETLLAHITRKSAQMLNLYAGMPMYAQIKGTSLLH